MYSPVKGHRLYEMVSDHIQGLIAARKLSPGERLPNERDLATQFEVSRTVVREALKTLADRGLVEIRTGQGTFVVNDIQAALSQSFGRLLRLGPHDESVADLVEVRGLIEPEIAYRAANRATPENIVGLKRAVSSMDASMESLDRYIKADDDFHLELAAATQNAFAPRLLHSIVDALHDLRGRIFQVPGGPTRGQHHHRRILRAVEEKAPEAAREAMRAHLRQVRHDSQIAGDDNE